MGHNTSPPTGEVLDDKKLPPNVFLLYVRTLTTTYF